MSRQHFFLRCCIKGFGVQQQQKKWEEKRQTCRKKENNKQKATHFLNGNRKRIVVRASMKFKQSTQYINYEVFFLSCRSFNTLCTMFLSPSLTLFRFKNEHLMLIYSQSFICRIFFCSTTIVRRVRVFCTCLIAYKFNFRIRSSTLHVSDIPARIRTESSFSIRNATFQPNPE